MIKDARKMTGVKVYLTALRLQDGELLIIATSQDVDNAVEVYKERWQIETFFSCLKERGFNFEDTHVTDRLRIKRLLVVPVIAFCWAHRTGEWHHENVKPIAIKKHQRPEKSIFKYGLDLIRDNLFKPFDSIGNQLHDLFQFIDFNKLKPT